MKESIDLFIQSIINQQLDNADESDEPNVPDQADAAATPQEVVPYAGWDPISPHGGTDSDVSEDIQYARQQFEAMMAATDPPDQDQYRPIDRDSLITAMLLSLDWDETGYLSQTAFRPLAAMLGLNVSSNESYRIAYMEFCGEYGCQPDTGISTEWLRTWLNDPNGGGYISGTILHRHLFGVWPRPIGMKKNRETPRVSKHPADVMLKKTTFFMPGLTAPTAGTSSTFPPVPPCTTLPGLFSYLPKAASSSTVRPPSIAAFPKPPPSLRGDPYELLMLQQPDSDADDDEP